MIEGTAHSSSLSFRQGIKCQRDRAERPCLIVCGGAILDFLGGKVSRAPAWLRRLGGEWIFRLVKEPKRLFMRYVVGNPAFLIRTLFCTKAKTLEARNTPRRI